MEVVHGTGERQRNDPAFMKQQKLGSHYNDGTTMPLNCTTARAISSLHVRFHVPCEFFLVRYFLCTCFAPKKDRALFNTVLFYQMIFKSTFFFIRGFTYFTLM